MWPKYKYRYLWDFLGSAIHSTQQPDGFRQVIESYKRADLLEICRFKFGELLTSSPTISLSLSLPPSFKVQRIFSPDLMSSFAFQSRAVWRRATLFLPFLNSTQQLIPRTSVLLSGRWFFNDIPSLKILMARRMVIFYCNIFYWHPYHFFQFNITRSICIYRFAYAYRELHSYIFIDN